jgi:hypothetical protein
MARATGQCAFYSILQLDSIEATDNPLWIHATATFFTQPPLLVGDLQTRHEMPVALHYYNALKEIFLPNQIVICSGELSVTNPTVNEDPILQVKVDIMVPYVVRILLG